MSTRSFLTLSNRIARQGLLFSTKHAIIARPSVRNSGHIVSYRKVAQPSANAELGAEIVATAMWWWILYHMFHEYKHITGEFPYPNPSDWTDE